MKMKIEPTYNSRRKTAYNEVSRKRGCIPADSFVRIWKRIARPNLCGRPA